jgi:hypothetical protein
MLSSTAGHISFSATCPRTALWPSATICAEAEPVEARMMLATASKKTLTFEHIISVPSIQAPVQLGLGRGVKVKIESRRK